MSPQSPDFGLPSGESKGPLSRRGFLVLITVFGGGLVLSACNQAIATQEAQLSPAPAEIYPMLSQDNLFSERPELKPFFEQWTNLVKETYPDFKDSDMQAFGIDFPGQDLPPAAFFEGRNDVTNNYVLSYVKGNEVVGLDRSEVLWADGNTYNAFGYLDESGEVAEFVPVLVFRPDDVIFISELGGQQPLIGAVGQARDILVSNSDIGEATLEAPDPMLEASQTIPKEWGTIDAESSTYSSPDGVIVGKGVPIELSVLTIDEIERNAIMVDGQWPLFIQNEAGAWEKTGIEYVDVKKPLVDDAGNPLELTYKYLGQSKNNLSGFFVAGEETVTKDGVEYRSIAASIDGKPEGGLMNTNLFLALESDLSRSAPKSGIGTYVIYYPNGIYWQGSEVGALYVGEDFRPSTLEIGQVFYSNIRIDNSALESLLESARSSGDDFTVNRISRILEIRQQIRTLFETIMDSNFNQILLEDVNIWAAYLGLASE